jgi:phage terminase small subunit
MKKPSKSPNKSKFRHSDADLNKIGSKLPRPPANLREDGTRLWKSVVAEYDLPPEALHILTLACESADRYGDARRALDVNGTTYKDRFGQIKPRPEVFIERDSRAAVARCLAQLKLDLEPILSIGRPSGGKR